MVKSNTHDIIRYEIVTNICLQKKNKAYIQYNMALMLVYNRQTLP